MPERRLSQAPTHPQHLVSLGTTLTLRNASFLGTIPTVPNLLRTIAAFGSHDTVPIVKVGIGAGSAVQNAKLNDRIAWFAGLRDRCGCRGPWAIPDVRT